MIAYMYLYHIYHASYFIYFEMYYNMPCHNQSFITVYIIYRICIHPMSSATFYWYLSKTITVQDLGYTLGRTTQRPMKQTTIQSQSLLETIQSYQLA